MNEPPSGGEGQPAAEILSAFQRRISNAKLFVKDPEDETSQLNRLGVAYFLLGLLPISTTLHRLVLSCESSSAPSCRRLLLPAQVRAGVKNSALISTQVLAEG